MIVQSQENKHGQKCRSLISVRERMIAAYSECKSSPKQLQVTRIAFVQELVYGPIQCRKQCVPVSEPICTAMPKDLVLVNCQHILFRKPLGLDHFASSRKAF